MMSKCINPKCSAGLESLGKGEVYAVERRNPQTGHSTEFFWLCSACLLHLNVAFDEMGRIEVQERKAGGHLPHPRLECDIRVVFPAVSAHAASTVAAFA